MIDTSKCIEFFDAKAKTNINIHIIGCGAIGSNIAELVTRMGFDHFHIYDFDTVEAKNIHNQNFTAEDIHVKKEDAVIRHCTEINPDVRITAHGKLETPYTIMDGVIILAVDNIDLRREILQANQFNPGIKCVLDFRMRLTDAQYYFAAGWEQYKKLLETMNFTHEEAAEDTVLSACHVEMNVVYIVKAIVALGFANLIKYLQEQEDYKNVILLDAAQMTMDCFKWKSKPVTAPAAAPNALPTLESVLANMPTNCHLQPSESEASPNQIPRYQPASFLF